MNSPAMFSWVSKQGSIGSVRDRNFSARERYIDLPSGCSKVSKPPGSLLVVDQLSFSQSLSSCWQSALTDF